MCSTGILNERVTQKFVGFMALSHLDNLATICRRMKKFGKNAGVCFISYEYVFYKL